MTTQIEHFYAYVVSECVKDKWIPRGTMVSPPGDAVRDFCEVGDQFFDMETHRITRIETLEEFGDVLITTERHGIHKDYMGQDILFEDGPVSITTLMGLTEDD